MGGTNEQPDKGQDHIPAYKAWLCPMAGQRYGELG